MEELLAALEEEDDGDERESGQELRGEAEVPAPAGSKTGTGETPEAGANRTAPGPAVGGDDAETEGPDWAREVKMPAPEGWERSAAAQDGLEQPQWDAAGRTAPGRSGAGESPWRELSPVGASERAGMPGRTGETPERSAGAQGRSGMAGRGLEELYRRTVQAARPAVGRLPAEQAGRPVRAGEPERSAALSVDELDRAVRRDSRRYDGGMTIF